MKLVEIINGYATDASVTEMIVALSKQLGKVLCGERLIRFHRQRILHADDQ